MGRNTKTLNTNTHAFVRVTGLSQKLRAEVLAVKEVTGFSVARILNILVNRPDFEDLVLGGIGAGAGKGSQRFSSCGVPRAVEDKVNTVAADLEIPKQQVLGYAIWSLRGRLRAEIVSQLGA